MKPSLPQGTRDFGPDVVRKRQYILNTIKNVFELYGFQPLETPAMENLETLMGKYGDEGDKLIFRLLDSGNPFSDQEFFKTFNDFFDALKSYNASIIQSLREKGMLISGPLDHDLLSTNPKLFASRLKEFIASKEDSANQINTLKNEITEKALKYDLTIPFARYVAMNHGQLAFPFKRYQIQPVWRADRPQRGRYREFYQCDADVVGSKSLLNEVELIYIYDQVFSKLGFKKGEISLKVNSRKIWDSIAKYCGCDDQLTDLTTAVDKYDKIGKDGVILELVSKGFTEENVERIFDCLFPAIHAVFDWEGVKQDYNLSNQELDEWKLIEASFKKTFDILYCVGLTLGDGDAPINPIKDLIEILKLLLNYDLKCIDVEYDPTLARGLNYYTGIIFEVKAPSQVKMGSIGGGGRYDDLTGLFGVPNIPGVGISFGVDRIYDVMEELDLFPKTVEQGTKVLFFNLGEEESKTAYNLLQQVRQSGVPAEIFHEAQKFDKQFKYAEKKNIPFVVIIGSAEVQEQVAVVKDLRNGAQQKVPFSGLPQFSFI